jgi:hypothetical protein
MGLDELPTLEERPEGGGETPLPDDDAGAADDTPPPAPDGGEGAATDDAAAAPAGRVGATPGRCQICVYGPCWLLYALLGLPLPLPGVRLDWLSLWWCFDAHIKRGEKCCQPYSPEAEAVAETTSTSLRCWRPPSYRWARIPATATRCRPAATRTRTPRPRRSAKRSSSPVSTAFARFPTRSLAAPTTSPAKAAAVGLCRLNQVDP